MVGLTVLMVLLFVLGFLVGSVNPATIIARVLGKDLSSGSGNPGATNAGRVLGVQWGVVVGIADVLKGLVPVLLTQRFAGTYGALVVGLAVILGHIWSPFLKGRGGKGVATSLGAILAIQPWSGLAIAVLFLVVVLVTRWVAAGSIAACTALLLLGVARWLGWGLQAVPAEGIWCVGVAAIVLYRHRANIKGFLAARRVAREGP